MRVNPGHSGLGVSVNYSLAQISDKVEGKFVMLINGLLFIPEGMRMVMKATEWHSFVLFLYLHT